MKVLIIIFVFCFECFSKSLLPSSKIYPDVEGIIFPSVPIAVGANPASLGLQRKYSSLDLALSSKLNSADDYFYVLSSAFCFKNFGLSLGTYGNTSGQQKSLMAGFGFSIESFSLGLSLRKYDVSSGFSPNVDLGFIFLLKDFLLALSIYNVESSSSPSVSIGFDGKRFNIEGGLKLPTFSDIGKANSNYQLLISANVFIAMLQIHFGSLYSLLWHDFSHSVGLGINFIDGLNLITQYSTTKSWTIGLNLSF